MTESSVSLVIDYLGETIVHSAGQNTTFSDVASAVCRKWQSKLGQGFKLRYYVGELVVNCCLEDDEDAVNMLRVGHQLGAKIIHVKVLETPLSNTSNSMGGAFHPVETSGHDISNNCQMTFNQLSANAFRNPPTSIDHNSPRPVKRSRQTVPAYELSHNFPTYDVCPVQEEQHLLSDHWGELITGIGQVFPGGAPDFRNKLAKYSTIKGFKYHYNQNTRQRIYVVCQKRHQSEACQWFVRANERKSGDGELHITDAELNHTCEVIEGAVQTARLSAELLASLIESDVRENPKMRGKDVKRLLKKSYGIDITYKQAWRALESARDKLFGTFENSFDQLRWYLEALLKANPGSVVKLEQNPETGRFERALIALKATLDGFKHCRPMLFVDGTFMRGRWKGVVLAATAKDGNDGLFPVAFAMVQSETTENWTWFLDLLNKHVVHEKPIYYISDRGSGLLPAFKAVWQKPLNFYCLVHLFNNLKGLYGNSKTDTEKIKMCGLLKRCAYAPSPRVFDIEMAAFIKEGGQKARDWIMNLEKEKWCVAFAPDILRYGEMTSNAAESFNHWIKDARALPITFMVDCIRIGIMRWFTERRATAASWTSRLTDAMQNKWNKSAHIGRSWGVLKGPSGKFEVFSTPNAVVDIQTHSCSCYQWQVTGFPCAHAISVIVKHYTALSGLVQDYYFKTTYISAYAGDIHSVPETDKFEFLNLAGLKPILPPARIVEKGRPKQNQIPSFGEFKKKKPWVCKKCNQKGRHDEVTCALST